MTTITTTHDEDGAPQRNELGGRWALSQLDGTLRERIITAVEQRTPLRLCSFPGIDLRDAHLEAARFDHADFEGANFEGANLRFADLPWADLRGANLRGANLERATLVGADLRGATLPDGVPVIANIHRTLYEVVTAHPEQFDMAWWHSDCGTTHCRAGWVIELAGEDGYALEEALGTGTAAALIYAASDPTLARIPYWSETNEKALDDMRRLAEQETIQ